MCRVFGIAAPHLAGPTASTLCVLFCSEEQWKQFNTNWGDELDGAIKCECLKNGGNDLIRIMPSMLQKPVASISHIAGPLSKCNESGGMCYENGSRHICAYNGVQMKSVNTINNAEESDGQVVDDQLRRRKRSKR